VRDRDKSKEQLIEELQELRRSFSQLEQSAQARDRAQRDLCSDLQFLPTVLDVVPSPVFYKDIHGVYLGCNRACAAFFGLTKEQIVGKSVYEVAPRELADIYHEKDSELFRKPGLQVYESAVQQGNGPRRDVIFYKSTFTDIEGNLAGLIGVILDITDRKQAEREREELKVQLFQAQKMQAIGTLTGGIAHDFNNLLTIILGYSELLLAETDETALSHSDLEKIMKAARDGAELVQRLLTFSKQTETKPYPLNLNQQVTQIRMLLSRTIPKMVEIELILADDLAMVQADPSRLDQIIISLAANAVDAMPDGGKLSIETRNVLADGYLCRKHPGSAPGKYVLLAVSDTGRGMDAKTMERMFDPFFTTKGWDARRGTGLGLSTVHGIVQHDGGFIECSSEPEKGTVINIYLPALGESEPQDDAASDRVTGSSETILLVDDEEHIRELGERHLKRAGYTVMSAGNGAEALEVYKKEQTRISLVILDLMMPIMGGTQCLRDLLRINPNVKVLIASGYSAVDPAKGDEMTRAKGFVHKPFDTEQLLKAVRNALDSD
jgi:two-component system, cell cycle sensor histidine kinase and response regulator CckA